MDSEIDQPLCDRCRWVVAPENTNCAPGEFVLYWMHNALRAHDNPALSVARQLAVQNGLPLLVYHGLSENYPFASDRHHAFILQGARDVQRELATTGVAYAFHLERPGHRGPHLRDLTRRAAVLVTEEMPVAPLAGWLERLSCLSKTPIIAVDTHNILPWPSIETLAGQQEGSDPQSFLDRIVKTPTLYREITSAEYDKRLSSGENCFIGIDSTTNSIEAPLKNSLESFDLGFQPLDLQDVCLARLIGECDIDHSVGPVCDSPGGTRAGYARWEAFCETGLNEYALRRTDPADPLGGSRLSAYVHYGMVSPRRVAIDAHRRNANKFLDEFLTWRELSFHFCARHTEDLDTLGAIPKWAQRTLSDHANDPRPDANHWESLARGQTNEPLWNAAQRSLLRHGELQSNLRMTWGKAFLGLTPCPEAALHQCIDLNHRYALDGRSASSYGGILWCFGQFDRTAESETEVFGQVRQRSIESHAEQIDVPKVIQRTDRVIADRLPKVAIVGAGIGGLIAARTLVDHGLDVSVFDKSRGVGGRLATRRNELAPAFDHGAQYFTVRDDLFARYVRSWIQSGIAAPWMQRIVQLKPCGEIIEKKRRAPRYVGTPSMNAIAKHLAHDLTITGNTHVGQIIRDEERWTLQDRSGDVLGDFDVVIANCPPEQTANVIGDQADFSSSLSDVEMLPCWALMLEAEGLAELPYAGAFINNGPLSWIARNDSKPGRAKDQNTTPDDRTTSSWVLHASAAWSKDHLEIDADAAQTVLLKAFEEATRQKIGHVSHCVAHRWRFANPEQTLPSKCLWDSTAGLGACGDWCGGPRVEGAFLSGVAMAGSVLRHFTIDRPIPQTRSIADQDSLQQTQ